MSLHSLTNFEIQIYYFILRLHKLYEYKSIGIYWIGFYVNVITWYILIVLESDTFLRKFENLSEIKILLQKFIENKAKIRKWENFCIWSINFMLKGKRLADFTNLFSSNNFKKNDEIILSSFWIKSNVPIHR